tara:strand:- start:17 stop:469 length:453 start_codon:yes stop_codon:yes gene_type:complete
MDDQSLTVVVTRQFPRQRQCVFDAFTNAENIARWLTPNKSTKMSVLSMSFEHQGGFRFQFDEADGTRNIVGGFFKLIRSPEKLVFSWTWEAPHQFANITTQVTVDFIDKNKQTEVVLRHEKLPSNTACDMHKLGWEGALDQLESHVPQSS